MPENEDAWDLWMEISTQWETSMVGRTGLKYSAMYKEAERMEIEITQGIKRKIQTLEAFELNRQKKDPASDNSQIKGR